jgi:hypothetical protein
MRLRSGAIESAHEFDLPPDAESDPTIADIVEFIISEARYVPKKRSGQAKHRPPIGGL